MYESYQCRVGILHLFLPTALGGGYFNPILQMRKPMPKNLNDWPVVTR